MTWRPFLTLLLLAVSIFFPQASANAASSTSPGYQAPEVKYPGMKKLTFRYGPLNIRPGQNTIEWSPVQMGPRVPGYITRFQPDLVYADSGEPAPGTHLHLHHVQWKIDETPVFPAGAEKTIAQFPRGFGYPLKGSELWRTNYMIHNLTATPAQVYLLWRINYVPKTSPSAGSIKPFDVHWMDLVGGRALFPIFAALRGQGRNGRYTFPDQASPQVRRGIGRAWYWRVPENVTLLYTFSHLHPGALFNSLYVSREGSPRRLLFRSRAHYFDRPGPGTATAPSWDMAISVTPPEWRIKLRRGDLLTMSSTVGTSRASWRESMGSFPLVVYNGHNVGGVDPFVRGASWPTSGPLSHGPLPGNRLSGGGPSSLPDPRRLPDGPQVSTPIPISGFRYRLGDLQEPAALARPPVVAKGQSLTFVNLDSPRYSSFNNSVLHTITACRAPCNGQTGMAYPLEDGPRRFDSGQLGFSAGNLPPAAGRSSWSTPRDLSPGTYTFFCRIHPFMRGAFRVSRLPAVSPVSSGWLPLPVDSSEVSGA